MVMSLTDAAERVLREHSPGAPMHYRAITEMAISRGFIVPGGSTPEASLNASINMEIRRREQGGRAQRFRAHGRGLYGLATPADPLGGGITHHNAEVRERLRALLSEMDPKEFEQLIGSLLASLGFEGIEVTRFHGDKGVDLRATLTVGGITDVRTAIQVKRWANNVRAPQIRELRGGLGPHDRGLVVTTAGFSAGAIEEAMEPDRSPISLVTGEQLLDLLINNEIGVKARTVQILQLDEERLTELEDEAVSGPGSGATSKFRSVWPLPGGNEAMKDTLDAMLRHVSAAAPTLEQGIAWMIERYERVDSRKTAKSYWTVPRSFGLTEMDGEQLSLTAEGVEYLTDPSEERLLAQMQVHVAGIDEILERLDDGPASNQELLELLHDRIGVAWETDAQVNWRMRWLSLCGVVATDSGGWRAAGPAH